MLNFKTTNIGIAVLLDCAIILHVLCYFGFIQIPIHFINLYSAIIILYISIICYGVFYHKANFFITMISSVKTAKNEIALTFDDGPDEENTPAVMDVLRKFGVKATFFCIGRNVENNPGILKMMYEEGHTIANHSYAHTIAFDFYGPQKMIDDIQRTNEIIKKTIGKTPVLFRPPFGVTNPTIKKAVHSLNLTPVGWTVRSLDSVERDEKKILHRVVAGLKPGAIVMFHDNQPHIPPVLESFIAHAIENGFKFVPLDKLINVNAYV